MEQETDGSSSLKFCYWPITSSCCTLFTVYRVVTTKEDDSFICHVHFSPYLPYDQLTNQRVERDGLYLLQFALVE